MSERAQTPPGDSASDWKAGSAHEVRGLATETDDEGSSAA